jgi:hypothetical protein
MLDINELLSRTGIPQNMVELQEIIGELEDNEPDKRKKEWKRWKERINILRKEYNRKARQQIYLLVK